LPGEAMAAGAQAGQARQACRRRRRTHVER
jgi:hypothetical protein